MVLHVSRSPLVGVRGSIESRGIDFCPRHGPNQVSSWQRRVNERRNGELKKIMKTINIVDFII